GCRRSSQPRGRQGSRSTLGTRDSWRCWSCPRVQVRAPVARQARRPAMMHQPAYLLSVAGGGIALLLLLIIRLRLAPFVSLLLVSAGVALAAGIPVARIVPQMETGMGAVLAHVAPIVGLGAMLGKLLEVSGGAQKIADRLLRLFGEKRAPLALGLTGLLLGIPLFFDVGVVVLAPVVYAAATRGGKGVLFYALPLAAGLAIVHGLLPPHPGPVAAAGVLHADMGLILLD